MQHKKCRQCPQGPILYMYFVYMCVRVLVHKDLRVRVCVYFVYVCL